MNDSQIEKLPTVYFPNLDACRFVAAFSVFLLHFSNEILALFPWIKTKFLVKSVYLFTSKGALGVNFFFVLSGFLITYLILAEKKRTGSFHLGKFLFRRTLRIWPLYFIIGFIGFIIFPLIFSDYSTLHQPLFYFTFLANFDEIWNGANDSINFLTSPWSVAVEEQFYLFWGILLFLILPNKRIKLPYVIGFIFLASIGFQWMNWQDERIIYHHTLAVCQDILMGAFIGWSLLADKKWIKKITQLPKWSVLLIYLLGIGICLAKNKLFAGQAIIFERTVISVFFGFVILDQINGQHSFFKLGKIKIFNYLGKISYAIYMYHLVVIYLLLKYIDLVSYGPIGAILILGILSVGGTFLLSSFSYRYIESKFLSLKNKWANP